jgi:uncharacterized membrane protein (UPF0127 family)
VAERRTLRGRDGGRVHVTSATTPWARMVGLLGRASLPRDEGLWLAPAWSIHTWAMRFPIDVVFVDHDGRVVRIVEAMRPWGLVSERRARAVVELAAGRARELGLAVGSPLPWE